MTVHSRKSRYFLGLLSSLHTSLTFAVTLYFSAPRWRWLIRYSMFLHVLPTLCSTKYRFSLARSLSFLQAIPVLKLFSRFLGCKVQKWLRSRLQSPKQYPCHQELHVGTCISQSDRPLEEEGPSPNNILAVNYGFWNHPRFSRTLT